MAYLDPSVARIIDSRTNASHDDEDEDDLLASLEEEDDPALSAFREQRLQQLHDEVSRAKAARNTGAGSYDECKEEKQVLDLTTQNKYAIVHFFRPDFGRCGVMDQHLETLAPKHFEVRFIKVNVDNAPFLVTKLKVQVLPCVIAFVDGVGVDRIIGFEGLGRGDKFTTIDLEARLLNAGVLKRSKLTDDNGYRRHSPSQSSKVQEDDDDGDDWD